MASGVAVAPPVAGSPEKRVTMNDPLDRRTPSGGGRAKSGSRGSGQERLTPMPGYMRPIVKSAVRRWKKLHEDHMMGKLMVKREEKKELNQVTREEARKLAKKIPMEALAKDWFKDNRATIETRAFLVDKILPTLIVGCEKLLIEVDRRGLSEATEPDPSFNPINFLGQYLMRNNPRYSNFSEASPYIRGLREISEELKKQLFDIEENRLARIKAEARRRREDRESEERRRVMEKKRREDLLRRQFNEWNIGYYPNGRVELALLQNALRIFAEVAENFPPELKKAARYAEEIGSTDDTGKMLSQKEFVTYITSFVEGMPSEIFDQFLSHMKLCATAYRAQKEREERRVTLSQLFISCDNAGVGLLDRHRVINLFEMFFDKAKEVIQETLRNPREWPVVDVQEVESLYGDEDEPMIEKLESVEQAAAEEQKPAEEQTEEKATEAQSAEGEAAVEGEQKETAETAVPTADGEAEVAAPDSAKTVDKPSSGSIQEGEEKTDQQEKDGDNKAEESSAEKVAPPQEGAEVDGTKADDTTQQEQNGGKSDSATGTMETQATETNTEGETGAVEKEEKPEAEEKASPETETQEKVEAEATQAAGEEGATASPEEKNKPEEKSEVQDSTEEKAEKEEEKAEKEEDGIEKGMEENKEAENVVKEGGEDSTSAVEEEKTEEPKATEEAEGVKPDETDKSAEGEKAESQPAGDDKVSEKEKAAAELSEKEKDESEEKSPVGLERVATGVTEDGERDPELTQLLLDPEDPNQRNVDTGKTDERPPMTQQSKVSFAEGTNFERETTSMPASRNSRCQSQASAFDENTLNVTQFVHMIETFLGDIPNMEAFHQLVRFIKTGYMETEEERMQRLFKARQEAQEAKRKSLLNSLFEMWDNDGSGNLDFEEVEGIMKKYKDGQEVEAINQAKKLFKKKSKVQDNRINKREFRDFVYLVVEKMSQEDAFDYFIEFMTNSVERSYAERIRGEARKKWLQQVVNTAETSGASMDPVYEAVFQSLYKDAETHGHSKVISSYIAMLERNDIIEERGDHMLRYVAATPDHASYMLGRALFRDMKGISFASVDSGKPLHVPRVSNHGNIHFWNPNRYEADGSFIVVPLKDRNKRVFGLLGIDTLNDPHSRALFITHEIQFFQGVAKAFSIAYHHVDVRQKTMRISESAVSWIHRRSPHVHEITVYMVEPDGKGQDYVLRKMMNTDHKGTTGLRKNPPKLERRDNLFRDYLFKCVDTSESLTADAYGERHLAIPLRDDEGLAIVVIDISIGDLKMLPRSENREVMKMLKLLQKAYDQISHESKEGEKSVLLDTSVVGMEHNTIPPTAACPPDAPIPSSSPTQPSLGPYSEDNSHSQTEGDKLDDDSRTEILFDRLMLIELRDNVSKLDPKAYAELKSYADPPRVVHLIVKAVLSIFYPDKAREGEFDQWSQCKQYVTPQLSQQIEVYDPTSDVSNDNVPVDMIHSDLEEVPHGQVYKHGSIPAAYLYNWVFVCISLIEHSRKMHSSSRSDLLTDIPPPAKKRENTNMGGGAASSLQQPQQLQIEQTNVSFVAEGSKDGNQQNPPPANEPPKEEIK